MDNLSDNILVSFDLDIFKMSKKLRMNVSLIAHAKAEILDNNTRIVRKEKINYSAWSRELAEFTDDTVRKSVNNYIELGFWQRDDDGNILIPEAKSFVPLKREFEEQLYSLLREQPALIYIWLVNQYSIWNQKKKIPYEFDLGTLCEIFGLSNQTKNRKKIAESLAVLVAFGLIRYQPIKKKIRNIVFPAIRLLYVSKKFETIDAIIEVQEELSGLIDSKVKMNENDIQEAETVEEMMEIGFQLSTDKDKKYQLPNSLRKELGDAF